MAQWEGVHYSDHDMLNMQQEAIRRVRQMQQRARQSLGGEGPPAGEQSMPVQGPAQPAMKAEQSRPAAAGQTPDTFGQASGASRPAGQGAHMQSPQGASPGRPQPPPAGGLGGIGEWLGHLWQGGTQEQPGGGGIIHSLIGENSPAAKALEALGIDNERLLLIGLLLVLLNEKADRTLLLALVYLLL